MIPVDHTNRRHAWEVVDGRNAKCSRCGALVLVTVDVVDAGVRAKVERHGPPKCPGHDWWKRYYWDRSEEPPPPWAGVELKKADRSVSARARSDRSDNGARPRRPSGRTVLQKASDRTDKGARPSKGGRK